MIQISAPQPVREQQRIISLDIIRGAAVLGILLINIVIFGFVVEDRERWDKMYTAASGPDFWTDQVIFVLFEGKMRALFCMLFGAGIMLFIQQKRKKDGHSPWALFYRRMGWLILFGLINAHLLLWEGDILYFYGIFGMVVFLFRNLRPTFKALGVPLVVLIAIITGQLYYQDIRGKYMGNLDAQDALDSGQVLSEEQEKAVEKWEEFRKQYLPNPEEVKEITAKMHGSYSEVASVVRPKSFEFETKYLPFLLGDNVALMLLGMALLQWGFFKGSWKRKYYLLTVVLGFGIGLPLVLYAQWHTVTYTPTAELGFEYMKTHPFSWDTTIYHFQRMFLAMGHAALLMLLIRWNIAKWLMKSLRAVGQMAFTNYILQSVLCTLFFFGYGLGYFEQLRLYQLYFVVLGVWIFEMILSPIWLTYFRFGPLEWLWRSLTYWKIMPFRK
jgi:uncharacterized protein